MHYVCVRALCVSVCVSGHVLYVCMCVFYHHCVCLCAQAARAADYTFSQFKSLVPLCLIHGRYSLHRTAFIAQYCLYKSVFICLLQV